MVKAACCAPLTYTDRTDIRFQTINYGSPRHAELDRIMKTGLELVFTNKSVNIEEEVPYGHWKGKDIGANHIIYKDVTGREHTYNALEHLKGSGTIWCDKDLARILNKPESDESWGALIYNASTRQLEGQTSYSWYWDGSDQFYEVRTEDGQRHIQLYRSYQDDRWFAVISVWVVHRREKTLYMREVDDFYDTHVSCRCYSIEKGSLWDPSPDAWAYVDCPWWGTEYTHRDHSYENIAVADARSWCENHLPRSEEEFHKGYAFKFIDIPNVNTTVLRSHVKTAAQHVKSLLPSWDVAYDECCATQKLSERDRIPAWTQLSARALEKITGEFDGNGFAYLKDCKDFIPSILQFKRAFTQQAQGLAKGKWKLVLAGMAASYLAIHYGFKLFAADTESLLEATMTNRDGTLKHVNSHMAYLHNDWQGDRRYTIAYDQSPILGTLREFLDKYDLLFRSENAWDLVPYSFVVDWFADIQTCLAVMDNYGSIQRNYQVAATIATTKSKKHFDCSTDYAAGHVVVEFFDRMVSHDVIPPDIFGASDVGEFSRTHLVEGAALTLVK